MKPSNPTSSLAKRETQHAVFLVDDHAVVREGFAELFNRQPDLSVCGQTDTAASAMEAVGRLNPDLVVVDLSLGDGSGLELIKNLKTLFPRLRMLVLSMHDEALYAERALRAGALGYVMKREKASTVLQAVRLVLNGSIYVSDVLRDRLLLTRVALRQPGGRLANLGVLSDRELEVFQLLGQGYSTRSIAQQLRLSVSTVETHRAHLKEKLGLKDAAELMRAAVIHSQST